MIRPEYPSSRFLSVHFAQYLHFRDFLGVNVCISLFVFKNFLLKYCLIWLIFFIGSPVDIFLLKENKLERCVLTQTIGFPMGTNCVPLLEDLFLYSYEADIIQNLLRKQEKKLALSFNFTIRDVDDILLLNNFCDYVNLIYPIEFKIKDTHGTVKSA